MQYSDLTQKIIGCPMRVHGTLGSGFREVIYQRAMDIEMAKRRSIFGREKEMTIYYDGIEIGTSRLFR